jgi:hypothetical protein
VGARDRLRTARIWREQRSAVLPALDALYQDYGWVIARTALSARIPAGMQTAEYVVRWNRSPARICRLPLEYILTVRAAAGAALASSAVRPVVLHGLGTKPRSHSAAQVKGTSPGQIQLDRIIGCVCQILFGAEVTLCRLDLRMTEQQLNLLQFPAGSPAQLRRRPS